MAELPHDKPGRSAAQECHDACNDYSCVRAGFCMGAAGAKERAPRPEFGKRIDLLSYVNDANISGGDYPHIVVEKLQQSINAAANREMETTASRVAAAAPTWKELRKYASMIENPDDRELVQHAADMLEIASRSTRRTTYDAVADAVQEVAEAANEAFIKAGLEPGEWDGDDIVKDVSRGISADIERLAIDARRYREVKACNWIGLRVAGQEFVGVSNLDAWADARATASAIGTTKESQ